MSFLMPWIMMYYYTNASSTDYFVAALSGKGYMYPQYMNDTALRAYYAAVPGLMARTDTTEVHTMNIGGAASEVATLLGNSTDGIFDGYGGNSYQESELASGTPLAHSMYLTYDSYNQTFEYLMNLKSIANDQPAFVFFNILNWDGAKDPHYWNTFAARLQAAGFEVVRPDVFAYLEAQALPINHVSPTWIVMVVVGLAILGATAGIVVTKKLK
jgi:hypothetical protein